MADKSLVEKIAAMDPTTQERYRLNAQRLANDPVRGSEAKKILQAFSNLSKLLSIKEKVIRAFRLDPLKEGEKKAVIALLDNPGHTSDQLSIDAGWNGNKWHMTFGELCKAREANLWPAEYVPARDNFFYSGILASFDEQTRGFTMKPEVVEAFRKLDF